MIQTFCTRNKLVFNIKHKNSLKKHYVTHICIFNCFSPSLLTQRCFLFRSRICRNWPLTLCLEYVFDNVGIIVLLTKIFLCIVNNIFLNNVDTSWGFLLNKDKCGKLKALIVVILDLKLFLFMFKSLLTDFAFQENSF